MSIKYHPHIDGLRAIAVSLVILFHYFPTIFPGGFVGVDVFFVISGFLITSILSSNQEEDTLSLRTFYHNRITRILPAYLVVIGSSFIAGWFLLLPSEYQLLGKHVFKSSYFYQNFNLLDEAGYFDLSSDLKPLLHLWSLAIEEQFYIIWPLIFILSSRKKKWIGPIIFAFTLYSLYYCVKTTDANISKAFYNIKSRFWELACGGILALYLPRITFKKTYLSILGFLAIVWVSFVFDDATSFPGFAAIIPVMGTCFIILDNKNLFSEKILSSPLLIWIGKISYPLYLWHWIVLVIVKINSPDLRIESEKSFSIKLVCLVLTLGLSVATYYFIEVPAKQFKAKYAYKFSLSLVFVLILSGAGGFYLWQSNGYPQRFDSQNKQALQLPERILVPSFDCKERWSSKDIEWCTTTHRDIYDDVVVIGDSHADLFGKGLMSYYTKKGRNVVVLGTGETLGFMRTGVYLGKGIEFTQDGYRTQQATFEKLLKNPPQTLILASRGSFYFFGKGYGHDRKRRRLVDIERPQELLENSEVYLQGLDLTLAAFAKLGTEVIFVYDNFEPGFDLKDLCIERPVSFIKFSPLPVCGIPKNEYEERSSTYLTETQKILKSHLDVKVFNTNDYLCDDNWCYVTREGIPYYSDNNHLSEIGVQEILKNWKF